VAEQVQVFDTPPVRLQVTGYQMVKVACPACRKVTRAAAPGGLAGPCCYGPDVRAATALLACNGHMSIERAADLMGVLLDAPVSAGFTGGLVARVAARLAEFEAALKQRLRASPVLHHDETPGRQAGVVRGCRRARSRPAGRLSASCPATAARWSATTTPPTPSTTSS
jgi:transposase